MDKRLFFFSIVLCFPLIGSWWLCKVRDIASLPVIDYRTTDVVDVGLTPFLQLTGAFSNLAYEVFCVGP